MARKVTVLSLLNWYHLIQNYQIYVFLTSYCCVSRVHHGTNWTHPPHTHTHLPPLHTQAQKINNWPLVSLKTISNKCFPMNKCECVNINFSVQYPQETPRTHTIHSSKQLFTYKELCCSSDLLVNIVSIISSTDCRTVCQCPLF